MIGNLNIRVFGCHLYFLLWCLYWLQGTFFPVGGIVSQTILAVLLVVSLHIFLIANLHYNLPKVLKTLSLLLFIFIVYGMVSLVSGETFIIKENGISGVNATGYLKNVLISILPIYFTFIAAKKKQLTGQSLRIWTFIFLVVAIVCYYKAQASAILLTGRDEITNNSAYSILAIIVMIPLFERKNLLQYIIIAICLYYVLIGMKRGALVCAVFATIWFLYNSIRFGKNKNLSFLTIALAIFIIIFMLYAFNYMLENNDYFLQRFESTTAGESSHRDELYTTLLNHFLYESDLYEFLLGNGANATLKISFNYAHNDWLEIAINNGLFMVIIYLFFWINMFKTIRQARNNNMCYMIISLFFIIYFLKTFFSMSYGDIPIYSSSTLGFALANYDQDEEIG